VTNPGDVAFPASGVQVQDASCDAPPRLVSKRGASGVDATPDTLDPGDTWVFGCTRVTAAGADCAPSLLENTGVVTGTAGGSTVDDEDFIATVLLCPGQPSPLPEVDPDEPAAVVPPGPEPPEAGAAGVAGLMLRGAASGCIVPRAPRVPVRGTRMRRIDVYVDGRRARSLGVGTLQAGAGPRVRLAPGFHRITVRIAFEPGAATPPVTLTRTVEICGPGAPRFTG
jgi:hypothetical protein